MFNNRFNNRNADPLVEAVKAAQADGDMRRQAIAQVNEAFGVYNRNAVVRENLAAYDAAIEEAYKDLKEGKPLSPKQKKMASLAGNPNKIDAADLASLRKGAKIDEKKGCYEEGNDGNLANNYPPYDKVTRGDVIAGATGKDQMGGKKKMDEKKGCYEEEQIDELKKPTAKTAMDAYYRAYDSDVQSGGEGKRTARLGRWKQKHLPGKSARNQKDTGKAELDDYDRKTVKKSGTLTKASQKDTKAEIKSRLGKHTKPKNLPEEHLDEVSKRTAISAYREKMAQDRNTKKLGDLIQNKWGRETAKHAYRAGHQDTVGLTRRGESHGTDRLASAKSSSEMRKTKSGKIHKQDVASKKSEIKFRGKMSKFDKKGHLPEETIEEAVSRKHFQQVADLIKGHESQEKRNELASHHASIFSKQNPRFDHGRFHKAAGSTAHEAPKSVKESVLEAVRAKYMKENNLEELSAFGKEFAAARKNNQSQFMSKVTGKMTTTQMKGEPAAKPSATATSSSSSSGGDTGYKSDGGRTVSLKPIAEPGTAQAAEPAKAAPTPAAQPKGWSAPKEPSQSDTVKASGGAAPADKPDTQTPQQRWDASRAATNTPAPGVASRTASAEVASGASAAKQSSDSVAKLMKMNESVQVGANKYRIV